MLTTLKYITSHPFGQLNKLDTLYRYCSWQIRSRLTTKPIKVDFVNQTCLQVKRGMTGATGNIYCGLHEFEDMGFVIHFLRKEDFFVDVGANVGSYTVLASGVCGCKTLALEPIPQTFHSLVENIKANGIEAVVEPHNAAAGKKEGTLEVTADLDTVNHALAKGEEHDGVTASTPVYPLVQLLAGRNPICIKIDVEGFETEVIAGMDPLLEKANPQVVIMELNGSGERYGFDEALLHEKIMGYGFKPFSYDPFQRSLQDLEGEKSGRGNTLYLKDPEFAARRVADSPSFTVHGVEI